MHSRIELVAVAGAGDRIVVLEIEIVLGQKQ